MLALKNECLKNDNHDVWQRVVEQLPNHSEARRRLQGGEWNMFQLDVVDLIRNRCFLKVLMHPPLRLKKK